MKFYLQSRPVLTLTVRFLLVNELKAFWKLSVQKFARDCFQNCENSRDGESLNARSFQKFESFELSKFRKQILVFSILLALV